MNSKAKILLEKYKAGTCTPEELALLESWYLEVAASKSISVNDININKIKDLSLPELDADAIPVRTIPNAGRIKLWQVAASIALIAGIGIFIYQYRGSFQNKPAPVKYVVNQTPKGKIQKIILADGSAVWLNAGSVFKYPQNFDGKVRNVELVDGQAFFDIKHMDNHPFVVKTSSLSITVLGTSFDVKAYKNEKFTKVRVLTGKVGVSVQGRANTPAIMLLPKQQVILNNTTENVTQASVAKVAVIDSWRKNVMIFEDEELSQVFKALERKYNIQITVEDKELLNQHISIKLNDQPLNNILEVLRFTKHFNYEMPNDSTVTIKK